MQAQCIDYRQLPEGAPLFLRYLYEYENVSLFYPNPSHLSLDHLRERADQVIAHRARYPRDSLVEGLASFNRSIGAGEATFRNLNRFRSPKAVAVVTGHQLGLFGGPAFTVYKALTTVRLARLLEQEGYAAVPVFWLASDDSDFEEVRTTTFVDQSGALQPVRYSVASRDNARLVGSMPLESVEQCFEELTECEVRGEFRDDILQLIRQSYARHRNFGQGFARWLIRLFRSHGLVVVDGRLAGHKSTLRSAFAVAIEQREELLKSLRNREKELQEEGFQPQVKVDDSESFLFWVEGDRRFKLEYDGKQYRGKGGGKLRLSPEKLISELEHCIEHLSPNVLLRPILQDHLLPTVVYVGGPSEIAYFAQVNAISPFWKLKMSVFPRLSMTVIDRKSQRLLARYNLRPGDVLNRTPEELVEKIFKQGDGAEILSKFEKVTQGLSSELDGLKGDLEPVDRSVAEMLENAEKKIFYQLGKVKNRFVKNYHSHNRDFARHLDHLYSRLYPEGKLQERVINFNQFLSEEGPAFLDHLVETSNPFCPSHQLIYL